QFAALLPLLIGHPRISLGRSTQITVSGQALRVTLQARLEANGEITLQLKEASSAPLRVAANSGWCFQNNAFQPLGFSTEFVRVFSGPVRISRQQVPAFLNQDWPKLANSGMV